MRTPDEIKKGLECCILETDDTSPVDHFRACPYQPTGLCFRTLLEDALTYIQQLETHLPKWISVEERLPEDNLNVLVYAIGNNENSVIAMTSYTHNMYGYNIEGWCSPWQYFFYEYKITHWMPLPEPPKEV